MTAADTAQGAPARDAAGAPPLDVQRGAGNWSKWTQPLDPIYEAAADWRQALAGVERPWLCWNVSPRWCLLQQRLVQAVGWTPVVGYDPRNGAPPLADGALLVDFNARLRLPIMYYMFVLDFVHLFAPRLAFWHADLLVRLPVLRDVAARFDALADGEMSAVLDVGGRRNLLFPSRHRYWELLGCTTRGASESMFRTGTGWWRHFNRHPNTPADPAERARRDKIFYDFGYGIMYWKRRCGGRVHDIDQRPLLEGHCTSINRPDYKRVGPEGPTRNLGAEIDLNYDIAEVARRLEIDHLLDPA
jgi:hypothetical protein